MGGDLVAILVPHFDFPFRFDRMGHVAVVQQDTEEDIVNCVHAALLTARGTRYYVPNFGITDPTFSPTPMDTSQLEREIDDSEPRASLVISQTVKELVDTLRVAVNQLG